MVTEIEQLWHESRRTGSIAELLETMRRIVGVMRTMNKEIALLRLEVRELRKARHIRELWAIMPLDETQEIFRKR